MTRHLDTGKKVSRHLTCIRKFKVSRRVSRCVRKRWRARDGKGCDLMTWDRCFKKCCKVSSLLNGVWICLNKIDQQGDQMALDRMGQFYGLGIREGSRVWNHVFTCLDRM